MTVRHEVVNALQYRFTCRLAAGLHARPASRLAERAAAFASDISLQNLRTGVSANAKSVLALIATEVRAGDECTLQFRGSDEDNALASLRVVIDRELPALEQSLGGTNENAGAPPLSRPRLAGLGGNNENTQNDPGAPPLSAAFGGQGGITSAGTTSAPGAPSFAPAVGAKGGIPQPHALPRTLRSTNVRATFGTPASPGIAAGVIVRLGAAHIPPELLRAAPGPVSQEQARAERALLSLRAQLAEESQRAASRTEKAVIAAHAAIAGDPSLAEKISALIASGHSAGQAVQQACAAFSAVLRDSTSAYIRERALDLDDVCRRLLESLYGARFTAADQRLTAASIVVADNLTPQGFLGLDRRFLRGLLLESAGATSHTLILARSFGIPALVGVRGARSAFAAGDAVVIDGTRGFAALSSPAVQRFYERESATLQRRRDALARIAAAPARTRDGRGLEVGANISEAEELETAFAFGADGIGVIRTEMLFVGREHLPSEEEQHAVDSPPVRAAAGRPVIIRLLDVGGDKPLPALLQPAEANPFLGRRGIRLYEQHEDVVRTQLRAILRASAAGDVRILLPMVSSVEEVRWTKALIARVQADLAAAGTKIASRIPLGIMIEVPAVAFALPELSAEVDFFSLGTNDLAQYFFAADRDNPAVAALAGVRHPAFLRFLRRIATTVRAQQRWLGVCGDMAADPLHLPLLIALGLDEISVPAPQVPVLKEAVARVSTLDCKALLDRATACFTAAEVTDLLPQGIAGAPLPLLEKDAILAAGDTANKEDAIAELCDALFIAGRTADRDALADAIFAREAHSSTALGHGFAIPHCKSAAISAPSVAVLRPRRPLEWSEGEDVRLVILLAMPANAQNEHLQVLARLARKLMDESFRDALQNAPDAAALYQIFQSFLNAAPASAHPPTMA